MKRYHALVVEDDDRIIEQIEDTLFSLGHSFDRAGNQAVAQQKIKANGFDYVLLDLHIPARPGRGGASVEFGLHLLKSIRQDQGSASLPVIIMTGQGAACVDLVSQLNRLAPSEYISKPWPDKGRTLASVIRAAMDRVHPGGVEAAEAGAHGDEGKPFEGGEMVFYPDRIELCGVEVVSRAKSSQMFAILETLKQRVDDQRYRAFSGGTLASIVGCDGGQGSIAGSVRDFRRHAAGVLRQELGFRLEQDDVIQTATAGYKLNAKITAKHHRDLPASAECSVSPEAPGAIPCPGSDDAAPDRARQVLGELAKGEPLRVPELAARLRCSPGAVKRIIQTLKDQGSVLFAGASRTGGYRLRGCD